MPEKLMLVSWDDGADLSKSRQKPGSYSPLTRDQNHGLGQVTLSDVDDHDGDDGDDGDDGGGGESSLPSAKAALAVVGLVAAAKAAPHVKRWLTDTALPTARVSRDRVVAAIRHRSRQDTAVTGAIDEPAAAASTEVAVRVENRSASMSLAEWHDRFRMMLLAGAVRDEQWRLLSTARIEDGDLLQLQETMRSLTPQQRAEAIGAAFAGHRPLLAAAAADEALLQELMEALVEDTTQAPRLLE